jgi:HD-GYP domain-containing protein (c-di-GMP phosphodiesterase class II)
MAGEDIPLAARILAVAEGYEAITAGRGCERLTVAAALEQLKAGSGSEFDPAILEALTKAVGDGSLESVLPAVAAPVPA